MGVVFSTETAVDERAEERNIIIEQGSRFHWSIVVTVPEEIEAGQVGWTTAKAVERAYMYVKNRVGGSTYLTLDSTGGNPHIEVDDDDSARVEITVNIPASETALINLSGDLTTSQGGARAVEPAVYDLYVVLDDDEHYRLYEGKVSLSPRVSSVTIS